MTRKRLAIIGNGMATCRLLDDLLRRQAPRAYDVTVFGEEPHGSYNRILLNRILGGGDPETITLKPRDWYAERGINFHPATRIETLNPAFRLLTDATGRSHHYDVCVLATGSIPVIPPVEGLHAAAGPRKEGVFVFRTIDDCERIRDIARPASSAVVVGGGLLGLEAAKGLCDLGMHVTVVHLVDTLMNTQLDRLGGDLLRKTIEQSGIFVRTGVSVAALLGDRRVEGVRLTDGQELPTDLVVFACGIQPRVELAKTAGIPVRRGVLVNDLLATQVPGVYAVGECAEHQGKVYGTVQPIWEQTSVLADVLTAANPQARYRGSKLYARLKVVGVEVASMGVVEPERVEDEVVQIVEERRGTYRKLIVRDDRLIGAILMGPGTAADAATLVQIFDRGTPLPPNRLEILCPGTFGGGDPEVCNCHHVTESTLLEAIGRGCTTLTSLSSETRAGTGCGSCRGQLANLILKNATVVSRES
jgi:nitrite reductase (NADH) large subunit